MAGRCLNEKTGAVFERVRGKYLKHNAENVI